VLTPERPFPILDPWLRAQAVRIGQSMGSARIETVVDKLGNPSFALLDAVGRSNPEPLFKLTLPIVVRALSSGVPLHQLIHELEAALAGQALGPLGLGILRFETKERRVELLNAGLPPIACVDAAGDTCRHETQSSPIGLLPNELHSYKLIPLTQEATWFLTSTGVFQGPQATHSYQSFLTELHLERWGSRLCLAPLEESSRLVAGALWRAELNPDDGACLFINLPGPGHAANDAASTRPPKKPSPRP